MILDNLPLNTKSLFVCGKAKSGCEIYIPVDNLECMEQKKKELQEYLDNQVAPKSV